MWSGELSLVQELPVDGSRTADGQGVDVVYRHTHTHTHIYIYTYIRCAFRVSLGDPKQATSCRLVLTQRPGPRVVQWVVQAVVALANATITTANTGRAPLRAMPMWRNQKRRSSSAAGVRLSCRFPIPSNCPC